MNIVSLLMGQKGAPPMGDIPSWLLGRTLAGGIKYDQWATDDWATIKAVSKAGLTAEAYGDQVGATREITLTNGDTYTIRLSNATTDMYDRADGSGTTGLCCEFVDCIPPNASMNSTATNIGGWETSRMRTETMAQLFDLLPSDLAAVIETTSVPAANRGNQTITVVNSSDKLFLLAEREVFDSIHYSPSVEFDALKQWQWYKTHTEAKDRNKKIGSEFAAWWFRSPVDGSAWGFAKVANGWPSLGSADAGGGVSPVFCI